MSMATRTDTHSPALRVADSHDLIRVHGARENNPKILRSARGAHRYSPKCPEGGRSPKFALRGFYEVRL
jgi:hypothetical protein